MPAIGRLCFASFSVAIYTTEVDLFTQVAALPQWFDERKYIVFSMISAVGQGTKSLAR
jgi:hypothetical protein